MTVQEEIEAITERLKFLKELQKNEQYESLKLSKLKFMESANTLDPNYKDIYLSINRVVETWGWKDFYYGVLNYQKHCIDSGYVLK